MTSLEEIRPGTRLAGILPGQHVTIVDVQWRGQGAVELTYKLPSGQPGTQLLFRDDEERIQLAETDGTWRFDADAQRFKLAAEAYRIHLGHLFDPHLAVHTSLIEPLPHQITGVYGDMLPRQPLRFLLADDPGAGKTIMAGLLIKELMLRGDVERCLVCVPGNLAGQWQDELWFKFQLRFEILTRDRYEAAVSGNAFREHRLVIVRLDQVARDEALLAKLQRTEWDLAIVDEAHKMSAHYWGGKLEETKRYKLGELLSSIARHFLLMTATPHNGKEEDFQLFLRLLDRDRFEGRFREGVHQVDISDLMRRMIKEDLVRFDGRRLFPKRLAHTVSYPLSPGERRLYDAVTAYVREEFNRADQLGDDKRRGTVGFALTILQRRLASSPEAIYRSLGRRRERLQTRLEEFAARQAREALPEPDLPTYDAEALDDLDDAPAEELEVIEEQVMDSATAAMTIAELEAEIETLTGLETLARQVRQSGADRKWEQLATILHDDALMYDEQGRRRKLVLFTEHRDTLRYLWRRIGTLFGNHECLVHIDGSVPRDARRAIEDRFRNDPDVYFLLATDAAAEGINLQRAHLMINYDLPWNPNRLEQRFGRIHRIGQTQVCHLWNLVAGETREGYVYERLLRKLATESEALQGKVFDVLGPLLDQTPLRRLLLEAIRYGERPEVRAWLEEAIDQAVDRDRIQSLIEARSLATTAMDTTKVMEVREEMERYAARRLQPHYIKSFFVQAFEALGGRLVPREAGRYQIRHVPARIRKHAEETGTVVPVWQRYERVCFDKAAMAQANLPEADLICPGHPLMDAVVDLIRKQHAQTLHTGTVLVDPKDPSATPRALFFLEQSLRDLRQGPSGTGRVVSREVHFVEINAQGALRLGGGAPYLDYRPLTDEERPRIQQALAADWLASDQLEGQVIQFAIERLVPEHLRHVRQQRQARVTKTRSAVHQRLTVEINYWDQRANLLREQERAGKPNAALNRARAEARADELAERLARRMEELDLEERISAAPPVIVGGALVIPAGMLLGAEERAELQDRRLTEALAMEAVMAAERALGHHPVDVSGDNLGYDIESHCPEDGASRYIEVKGRRADADTVTVTRNEIMTALNAPERFILAVVVVDGGHAAAPRYVRRPFVNEPDAGAVSVTFRLGELLSHAEELRR
jgi:superfamily II DNA or RNA helicase